MTGPSILTGAELEMAMGSPLGDPMRGFGTVAAAQVGPEETTAIPGIQVAISGIGVEASAADNVNAAPSVLTPSVA